MAENLDWRAIRRRCGLVCKIFGLPNSQVDAALADDPEGIIDFAHRTGQSLDWLILGAGAMRAPGLPERGKRGNPRRD